MPIDALDFFAIVKEYTTKTANMSASASIDLKDLQTQEEEILAEIKEKLDKQEITQEEAEKQRTAIQEKKKAEIEKWRGIIQDGDDKIFNEVLPKFESILTINEDYSTLPLSNGRILTIPSDYTPKEMNIIANLLKEFENAELDGIKTTECITKARNKCIELGLRITLDGECLDSFAEIDIENTKFRKLPIVIALLPEIVNAIHFLCKYNRHEMLKKK